VITRGHPSELMRTSATLALWAPLHGHTCIDLRTAGSTVAAEQARVLGDGLHSAEPDFPQVDDWCAQLAASHLVRVVNVPDDCAVLDDHPLVLHGTRLYTQRQWIDECVVAAALRNLAAQPDRHVARATLDVLADLLPPTNFDGTRNDQHVAARSVLSGALSVVVGGPGTGKTHMLARVLVALSADATASGTVPLSVGLAAPTGKAAARLTEAIGAAAATLPSAHADALRGLEAVTVHRLLGHRPGRFTRFRHDASNPLPYDVVVIDETSMVALPLMARLVEALPSHGRLVLVGDPDQLESVEVGSVLPDVVAARPGSNVARSVVRLIRQHRQLGDSPIVTLADAIRNADPDGALSAIDGGGESLVMVDEAHGEARAHAVVGGHFGEVHRAAAAGDSRVALARLGAARVLCAHRRGPYGVEHWNRIVEGWLLGGPARARWFPGRMVAVTRNDARTQLTNGDSGVVVAAAAGHQVCFAGPLAVRAFHPAQLDAVDTAFAVTVHKSQGSEYEHVVVVLPPPESPLVSRELLYTAVTRARTSLLLIGSADSVRACIAAPARRTSGLAEALGDAPAVYGQLTLLD
jgi:exodeoxyribonuclease V alpha subunit